MICISNIRLHEGEVPRFMDFDLFEFFTIIENREICWWPIFESRAINLCRFNVLVDFMIMCWRIAFYVILCAVFREYWLIL